MNHMFSKTFNKNSHLFVLFSRSHPQRQTLATPLAVLLFFKLPKHVYRALAYLSHVIKWKMSTDLFMSSLSPTHILPLSKIPI